MYMASSAISKIVLIQDILFYGFYCSTNKFFSLKLSSALSDFFSSKTLEIKLLFLIPFFTELSNSSLKVQLFHDALDQAFGNLWIIFFSLTKYGITNH